VIQSKSGGERKSGNRGCSAQIGTGSPSIWCATERPFLLEGSARYSKTQAPDSPGTASARLGLLLHRSPRVTWRKQSRKAQSRESIQFGMCLCVAAKSTSDIKLSGEAIETLKVCIALKVVTGANVLCAGKRPCFVCEPRCAVLSTSALFINFLHILPFG
jgi:hypothetical protein